MSDMINLFFTNEKTVNDKKPIINKKKLIEEKPIEIKEKIIKKEVKKQEKSINLNEKDKELRKILLDDIKKVSSMSVEEHLLYEKWLEINDSTYTQNDLEKIKEIKNNLWIPNEPNDYLLLEPDVIIADGKDDAKTWSILRKMTHSAKWSQSPGRFGKFLVIDKITKKYLGLISIGSDFISIGGRDSYIGWSKEDKITNGKLKNTCMASTISPTQPLGYNYMGGKLISLLTVSNVIENFWYSKYNDILVGVSTTSLFGGKGQSQYTGLKFWHECKFSEGKIPIEPSEEAYRQIKKWIKEEHKDYYDNLMSPKENGLPVSHTRPRLIAYTFSKLGVKSINNNFTRGVYFSELYKNTKEFLCDKNNEPTEKKFDNSIENLTSVWKQHYARKRVAKMVREEKFNKNILFYDGLIGLSWEETKEKYLKDIGR